MKNRGFTLIELMIVLAIIAIIGSVAVGSWERTGRTQSRNPAAECVSGYLVLKKSGQQLKNENGGGIPCSMEAPIGYVPMTR